MKRLLSLLGVCVLLSLFAVPAHARAPRFEALQPGEFVTFTQTIPINLVFVGYENLSKGGLLDELPAAYDPVARYPQFYGLSGRNLGLHFNFQYRTIETNTAFENRFFGYLKQIGRPGPLTALQQQYNDQEQNVLDVQGPVLYIDAPSVEQWLASRTGELGIDRDHSYTVYFINWYSRDDFKFHVYTKTDEPDPDTGYNFGVIRETRKMIAWGGSFSRSWFYDLSAGPESWTDNWNVDTPDLDGNGVEDYRMPPVWEYRSNGYRNRSRLDDDLGLVTRYVAINLLFTSSPLYDPLVTAPGLGGRKVIHIELFEDDPNSRGIDFSNKNLTLRALRSFEPYYDWKVVQQRNNPIDPQAQRALQIFSGVLEESDCWDAFETTDAELFCFFDANYSRYIPEYKPEDYVGEIFSFNTTEETLGDQFGLLGFADEDYESGTQTYVFVFGAEAYRELGYGFTTTYIHEFGHHVGLSHPHDGYDSERALDYGPEDEFYYAWSGDESDTVMHYIALSNSFGEFDRANMYRYEFAGYLNWSNALLGDILASPDAGKVDNLLRKADQEAKAARRDFEAWNYLGAATNARQAYERLLKAAQELGIETPTINAAQRALPNATVPRHFDPIRGHDD
jgi:hypothetical protein